MGRVIVTGAGHSGTNLALEILRFNKEYDIRPDDGVHTEDRQIPFTDLPENYVTKLCTENDIVNEEFFDTLITQHDDLKVIFCVRNPIDTSLARIYRYKAKYPHTPINDIKLLNKAADILDYIGTYYPERLIVVDLPLMVRHTGLAARSICEFCNFKWDRSMRKAYRNIKQEDKKAKYNQKLDLRQADLLKYEEELFGDFWKQDPYDEHKELVLEYFKNGGEVWKDRVMSAYWLGLMET